jgi:hypothetical protein
MDKTFAFPSPVQPTMYFFPSQPALRPRNLDHIDISGKGLDESLDDFLSDYDMLSAAYRQLIDKDMAYDGFSYALEKRPA